MSKTIGALLLTLSLFAWANNGVAQDTSVEVDKKLATVKTLVDEAGSLFKKKSYSRSRIKIRSAKKRMAELVRLGDPKVTKKLENDYGRIEVAQKLLAEKGEDFDALVPLKDMGAVSDTSKGKKAKGSSSGNQVSFMKQVVPILSKRCGQCHVQSSKGGFSSANFAAIKKGGRKGKVFTAGQPDKSSLYTLIKSGKMPPRSGNGFPKNELKLIKDWIAQGAKFDGKDESANLSPGRAGNPGSRFNR